MSGPTDSPPFTELVDLASVRFGGEALAANDEFFAPAERLLLPDPPVFREDAYTDRGKWMDGWETRRRREPGHDWCLIRLGLPGVVRGVEVSTRHFRGNHPQTFSLEACAASPDAAPADLLRGRDLPDLRSAVSGPPASGAPSDAAPEWWEVLPRSPLDGDARHFFEVPPPGEGEGAVGAGARATHLLLHIHPDGGIARLRIHGEVRPDWEAVLDEGEPVDLAGLHRGGLVVTASDGTFADPRNLILPGRAENMGEGWETRRRRGPGHDWAILALGHRGTVSQIVVDTRHFKGNYPEICSLETCDAPGASTDELAGTDPEGAGVPWRPLLSRSPLGPDAEHRFREELDASGSITHVRLNIFPDGGVSRLRVRGRPTSREVGPPPVGPEPELPEEDRP